MDSRDASFTFLSRIEEIESNISDHRWQSALALALTVPDICGGIAFPEIVKRYKDGRIVLDRQKNPTRDVGGQYIRWFDTYAASFFKVTPEEDSPYICGERCWQLRCEYLHQNKGFSNDSEESKLRFHLGVNCGSSVCQQKGNVRWNGGMDIRIDIEQFCTRMCAAGRNYYEKTTPKDQFSLYNTLVLDFIELTEKKKLSEQWVIILCQDGSYGKALKLSLQNMTSRIDVFSDLAEAKAKLGKMKPALWIFVEPFQELYQSLGEKYKNTPILVLKRPDSEEQGLKNLERKIEMLDMPVVPSQLLEKVKQWID